ncbi:hypothetical protein CFC21_043276 [Triticum aestivum]|uniref:F-box domain-containing protein n=2 Tax=Triticum aestivum TaxID=4565 RepID=A0A9R1JWC3_WHEAT|nr:hypothetical protein CFC21_043276 [Triticum aestivum]CDM85404.1 unnamed protein product [Triticum aestivum]
MRSPPRTRCCSLHRSAAAALPYCRKGHRKKKGRRHREGSGGMTASLSDDSLASIFARLPDVAAVIRCATTCRRWARVVATRAAIISRSLPPLGHFLPDLAIGVFHQEKDWPTARGRDTVSSRPCFAARAHFLGVGGGRQLWGLDDDGGLLDYSRPVASRNGRLVLELRHEGRAVDGLRLAVYNPMMSDNNIVIVPPLIVSAPGGKNSTTIRDYGCALLTGHDLRPPGCQSFFRLLLIYNHKRRRKDSTILRCYSSNTGRWGPEAESDVRIHASKLRCIGQAVVRRGVAFWALDHGVLGVRLDHHIDQDGAVTDMHLLPYNINQNWSENRLLGISADNRLFMMHVGVRNGQNKIPLASFSYFEFPEEDDIRTGRRETVREHTFVLMHQMKMEHHHTGIKLR